MRRRMKNGGKEEVEEEAKRRRTRRQRKLVCLELDKFPWYSGNQKGWILAKTVKVHCLYKSFLIHAHTHTKRNHHHHQVPDLEQTLATMLLQTSLSSDNFKKFKPLLCPPVAELQRLSRNVIRCLPLSRLPSTLPVKDKNSKPLRLHTCPKNSICLFLKEIEKWNWS